MKRLVGCLCVLLLAVATPLRGQEATERFLPIGQSPGQSGKTTRVGTVESVNLQAHSFTVAADGQVTGMAWTGRTRFWLDRSRQQLGTLKGAAGDIQAGRRVEIKADKNDAGLADWIKIDPVTPN